VADTAGDVSVQAGGNNVVEALGGGAVPTVAAGRLGT
jgi:hypothetical protein